MCATQPLSRSPWSRSGSGSFGSSCRCWRLNASTSTPKAESMAERAGNTIASVRTPPQALSQMKRSCPHHPSGPPSGGGGTLQNLALSLPPHLIQLKVGVLPLEDQAPHLPTFFLGQIMVFGKPRNQKRKLRKEDTSRPVRTVRRTPKTKPVRRVKTENRNRTGNPGRQSSLTVLQASESRRRRQAGTLRKAS